MTITLDESQSPSPTRRGDNEKTVLLEKETEKNLQTLNKSEKARVLYKVKLGF